MVQAKMFDMRVNVVLNLVDNTLLLQKNVNVCTLTDCRKPTR